MGRWRRPTLLAMGCLLISIGLSNRAGAQQPPAFRDIQGNFAQAEITELAKLGIVHGVAADRFGPNLPLSRAAWAVWLAGALKLGSTTEPGPQDAGELPWAQSAIDRVVAHGLMQAKGGLFHPRHLEQRIGAFRSLLLALDLASLVSADAAVRPPGAARHGVKASDWGVADAALATGLTHGSKSGVLSPYADLTRAQGAALLVRLFTLQHVDAGPSTLSISSVSPQQTTLSWTPVSGAQRYIVDRAGGDGTFVRMTVTARTNWIDSGENGSSTAYYVVHAVLGDGSVSLPSPWAVVVGLDRRQRAWGLAYDYSGALNWRIANAKIGDMLGLGGMQPTLLPPAKIANEPPPKERTLYLSDAPEQVPQPGILYQDTLQGRARIYFDAVNDFGPGPKGSPANYLVEVHNQSTQNVTLTIKRQGFGGPAPQDGQQTWFTAGAQAMTAYLSPQAPSTVTLGPGELLNLAGPLNNLTIPYGDLVTGIIDLSSSAPVNLTFAMVAAGYPPLINALPVLPTDGHSRGTYANADRVYIVDANHLSGLSLGDGSQEGVLKGQDALSGKAVKLTGNYGTRYTLEFRPKHQVALLMVPEGGAFMGSAIINGHIVALPSSGLYQNASDAISLGTFAAGQIAQIVWMPPASSSLPVELVFVPLHN